MHGKRPEGCAIGGNTSLCIGPDAAIAATSAAQQQQSVRCTTDQPQTIVRPTSTIITTSTANTHTDHPTTNTHSDHPYSELQINVGTKTQILELMALQSQHRQKTKNYWRIGRATKKILKTARIASVENGFDARPHLNVTINGASVRGLLDSGANISCVGRNAFETLSRCELKCKNYSSNVLTASGQKQSIVGYTDATICYNNEYKTIRLYIIPSLSQEMYLGIDFWLAFNLLPCFDEIVENKPVDPNMHVMNIEQKAALDKIVQLFPSCELEGLGKTSLLKHTINIGDAMPIKQRYHSVSPAVEQKMFAEVDRMLSLGVIEVSRSAWNSPVTVVAKSNGKSRLCLDARHLNSVTKKDAYPMPLIDGILARLNETYYISSIDLKDAFWQIELDEQSREKTAFTVPGRPLYQFTRMPFGLCNAAQSMCRLMDLVIPSEMREFIFVYIDDLLIVSSDFETHMERLQLVANCLRQANLTINVSKSKFCMRSIRYLGHIVGDGQLRADPERIKCISQFPVPTTVKQVRRFLGMAGWYQRYINNYSAIAAPMTDLFKKVDRFCWTPQAQTAFDALKISLTTAPVLRHPNFQLPFYIQCDASKIGVGGVLFQLIDGEEHPIAFMSKKLNTAQQNYSVTELECLAAVLCVKRFRCYIEGMAFTIITDHASLKWLMNQKDLTGRLARWSLKLQAFDFTIIHRKGAANIVPDALSRVEIDEIISAVGKPLELDSKEFESDEYKNLRRTVEEHESELIDVKVIDGVIYKRTEFRTGNQIVDTETVWKIWVPESLRADVITNAHQPPSASHGGRDKTTELIRRYYYWPGLARDVRLYVSACSVCKETKSPNQILRPAMGRELRAERPFQRLYVDLLGPYPRSKSGNTTILIILDQLSKFVWLKALRKATATAIVCYIESEIFHQFGAPESIFSDNGVQFISKEFKGMAAKYGVKQMFTATHAPQANASERVNRSIVAAIRAYVEKDHTNWDAHLSSIASALRNSVHSSSGHSPYFVVFGQHMVQHAGAFAILRKLQLMPSGDLEIVPPAELRSALNEQVAKRLQVAHERNEKHYNKRSRNVTFRAGQEVYVRSFQQSEFKRNFNAKLAKQWLPARIIRSRGSCLYEVEDRQGKVMKCTYHAKDIRI